MKIPQAGRTMVLIFSLAVLPAFADNTHHTNTPGRTHASLKHVLSRHHLHGRKAAKPKGQRQIDPERATQIQAALIHENYLSGTPSGQWDSDTEAAMQRYQGDHGWQTKLTPDSRALIKLGLGPSQNGATAPAPSAAQAAASSATATNEGDTLASAHAIQQ
jgi:hypothetical protein